MQKMLFVILKKKFMCGTIVSDVQVIANADNAEECLLQNWVDERAPYPKGLIERCSEMGLTAHMNLAQISDGAFGKQSIGREGDYVLGCRRTKSRVEERK